MSDWLSLRRLTLCSIFHKDVCAPISEEECIEMVEDYTKSCSGGAELLVPSEPRRRRDHTRRDVLAVRRLRADVACVHRDER